MAKIDEFPPLTDWLSVSKRPAELTHIAVNNIQKTKCRTIQSDTKVGLRFVSFCEILID